MSTPGPSSRAPRTTGNRDSHPEETARRWQPCQQVMEQGRVGSGR